jgi:hypothetical protein
VRDLCSVMLNMIGGIITVLTVVNGFTATLVAVIVVTKFYVCVQRLNIVTVS